MNTSKITVIVQLEAITLSITKDVHVSEVSLPSLSDRFANNYLLVIRINKLIFFSYWSERVRYLIINLSNSPKKYWYANYKNRFAILFVIDFTLPYFGAQKTYTHYGVGIDLSFTPIIILKTYLNLLWSLF